MRPRWRRGSALQGGADPCATCTTDAPPVGTIPGRSLMRTFWIPLIVLPLGCAHQSESMVASEPAPPPPAVAQAEPTPPPKEPPKQEVASAQPMTCGLARVHFEFDKAELTDANKIELDQ